MYPILLRQTEVIEITGLSRNQISILQRRGLFPSKQLIPGCRNCYYVAEEIRNYMSLLTKNLNDEQMRERIQRYNQNRQNSVKYDQKKTAFKLEADQPIEEAKR